MNIFKLRDDLVSDYAAYVNSFIKIQDDRVREKVKDELNDGKLWPRPLLQLIPLSLQGTR